MKELKNFGFNTDNKTYIIAEIFESVSSVG